MLAVRTCWRYWGVLGQYQSEIVSPYYNLISGAKKRKLTRLSVCFINTTSPNEVSTNLHNLRFCSHHMHYIFSQIESFQL